MDQARVVSVPRGDHGAGVANVRDMDSWPFEDEHRARCARGLYVDVLLPADFDQFPLRRQKGLLHRSRPILAEIRARCQKVGQGLDESERHQVPEGAVSVADAVDLKGSHVHDEIIVLIGRGVGILAAFLAQHRRVSRALQPAGSTPCVSVLPPQLFALRRRGWHLRPREGHFVVCELLPEPPAAEHLKRRVLDEEPIVRPGQYRILEVLRDAIGEAHVLAGLPLGV
mmetsp:Transcript_128326/g.411252  ORF Transcript_128326/g.411252 Transcript_128326/m.411252 type:complete len:227 (-) Transcript_128326:1535-2215(-)